MILNRTDSPINREGRNKINENWETLEHTYKKVVDVSEDAKTTAVEAKEIAEGIDGKATEALNVANQANAKSDNAVSIATEKGNEAISIVTAKGNEAVNIAKQKGDESISIATQKGNEALDIANQANDTSNYVQHQLDTVILESGDANPEVIQARADFVNLRERLDTEFGQVTTQLAQKTYYSDTVNAMLSITYNYGDTVKTLGYHTVNDGGGNLYIVISPDEASVTKSYDLVSDNKVFRPIASGVIHPKMFGTYNDGLQLDNLPLQACYDYSVDYGIEHIDGLDLLYNIGTVNKYDTRHFGAVVTSGRKLSNFNFKTANGSDNMTTPLTLKMTDKPIYLENITIDGNRANLSLAVENGAEDGGCHGIFIFAENIISNEFSPCGDIYMKNVSIDNIYSYGVCVDPLDCLLKVEDCYFNAFGIAVLAHTTRFEMIGGKININQARAGRVNDAVHSEMEFGGNYTGNKKKNISIRNVQVTSTLAESLSKDLSLFKMHHIPESGVVYENIKIEDCFLDHVRAASIYNSHPTKKLFINEIKIKGNFITSDLATTRSLDLSSENEDLIEVNSIICEGVNDFSAFYLRMCKVYNFIVSKHRFNEERRLWLNNVNIDYLQLKNIANDTLSAYGIIRDNTSTINHFDVRDCDLKCDSPILIFEANIKKITAQNLNIKPNANGKIVKIFSVWTNTTKLECICKDILLEGTEYEPYSYFLDSAAPEGYVYLNNVKHITTLTNPKLNTGALPTTNIKMINCENLI